MPQSNGEWDFYFGRGGGGNHKRKISRATTLLQDLTHGYISSRQTEKRLFVKMEFYDTVVKNGGSFFQIVNQQPVDVTANTDAVIAKIMQSFRDRHKTSKAPPSISLKTIKLSSTKNSSQAVPSRRPKRRCTRPSIIEPPVIEPPVIGYERGTIPIVENEKATTGGSTSSTLATGNTLGGVGESTQKQKNERVICHLPTGDEFEKIVVEPPKLENSFSALIMNDEITAVLPRDSQENINRNLHARVQRLENLVLMLMSQKNDEMESLLTYV